MPMVYVSLEVCELVVRRLFRVVDSNSKWDGIIYTSSTQAIESLKSRWPSRIESVLVPYNNYKRDEFLVMNLDICKLLPWRPYVQSLIC